MKSASREYRIERYTLADLPAICSFQELLWQGGERGNRNYFAWKFHQNPYLDDRYVLLAWAEDRLIGMIGAFGAKWTVPDGRQVMLPCIADTVVAPDYRGSPVFLDMLDHLVAQLLTDGIPWLLDFGDQPAGPAMMLRGWRPIGPWSVAAHTRPAPIASAQWPGAVPRRGRRSGEVLATVDRPDPAKLAAVNALCPVTDRIAHIRDETFLRWRLANPLSRYWTIHAGPCGEFGYLLAHRTTTDSVEGPTPTTILDCEAVDDAVWTDLLDAALEVLPGREVLLWTRDLTQSRRDAALALGMEHRMPTGRITADMDLPNLLMRATGAPPTDLPLLDRDAWDLRSVCGRSWR